MATHQDLGQNPNSRQQYDDWRQSRADRGEDATDYAACRQHVVALNDFVVDDFKAAHPERYSA